MSCPHCGNEFEDAVESCPKCRFDLAYCEKEFPFAAPPLSLVLDPAKLLPAGIEREVRKAYEKVLKRTPQVKISFCFLRLQPGVPIEEFAFWLHNSAPAADETRAWQLLVVGDLTSGHLTLTSGYALEPFIKINLWEPALQELAACIADDQWKEGLNGFLVDARVLLTAAWQAADQRRHESHRRRSGSAKKKAAAEEKTFQQHGPQAAKRHSPKPSPPQTGPEQDTTFADHAKGARAEREPTQEAAEGTPEPGPSHMAAPSTARRSRRKRKKSESATT